VIVIRYDDDIVLGFQYELDAIKFQFEFQQRLERFGCIPTRPG
jgi:hypothetical protein